MLVSKCLPNGPHGSPSRFPSPNLWESELKLISTDSWSVLMKLCLARRETYSSLSTPASQYAEQDGQKTSLLNCCYSDVEKSGTSITMGLFQCCV